MPQDIFTKLVLSIVTGLLIFSISGAIQNYTKIKVISERLRSIEAYDRERLGNIAICIQDQEARIRALEFKQIKIEKVKP